MYWELQKVLQKCETIECLGNRMTIVVYSPLAVEAGSHIVVSIDGPSGWSR